MMTEFCTILPMAESIVGGVWRLDSKIFQYPVSPAFLKSIAGQFSPHSAWVVPSLADEKEIAGYIAITRGLGVDGNPVVSINSIAVDKPYRRNEIGASLVGFVVGRAAGGVRVTATVPDCSTDAQKFFRACGFTCVAILRNCYDEGGDGLLFLYPGSQEPQPKFSGSVNCDSPIRLRSRIEFMGRL
jgi:ribosomal protein S18 acetylase RimI-like enzyme